MKKKGLFIIIALLLTTFTSSATKLVSVSILDKDYIMLYFRDGDVIFNERAISGYPLYETNNDLSREINTIVKYGNLLNTSAVTSVGNWKIMSTDDSNFGTQGVTPTNVYRKSKLSCMAQLAWSTSANDYSYDWAYEHSIFLKLPKSMESGKSYTIQIPNNINSDVTIKTVVFDIFNNRSEAIKVNIVGYSTANSIKSADVYIWMGDGGSRDYSTFIGKKIFIYNTITKESKQVGQLSLWKAEATETSIGHRMLQTPVWKVDFTGFNEAGTYRLAVEDIGCSDDFKISDDIYYEPYKISTQGFFYMRIGEDNLNISPVPRRPLFIPGKSPANCVVYKTTMHPYHANWNSFTGGDKWDGPNSWAAYRKPGNPTNPNAWGGHSDALDWDRHLGHVSIIYDLLLPYFITKGALSEDNLGITESGNGIPDVIDEARNEVDFWLRLRDGMGYSHGLTNPVNASSNPTLYQAENTAIAAWANAANAAMLGDCFRISGHADLMAVYRDSAIAAYNYANNLPDPMLTRTQGVGDAVMSGRDFKITAAAFLYNLTGDVRYENDLITGSRCTSNNSILSNNNENNGYNEIYAIAGYLFTNREVHIQTRYNNMKNSIIAEAISKETNFSNIRPSRRSTDNDKGWFVNSIHNQRTIIAHAISDAGSDEKKLFEEALILEADFSLGRNPLNMIHMTTATTSLANKKSPESAYTSGWNDGSPGVHPGHTPYMNIYDWGGLIMGCPKWMVDKNYPSVIYSNPSNPANGIAAGSWPYGELYYNTRYVYAANEFTPQQSMRGKQALYGYLHAISPAKSNSGIEKEIISLKNNNALFIYPVPGNDIIQISDVPDGAQYTIYSITGMKIESGTILGKTIDISQLVQGIYLLTINNLQGKFIKM